MPPLFPTDAIHRASAVASHSPRGRVLPGSAPLIYADVPAMLRGQTRNDSVLSGVPPRPWNEAASYREQSERFPYVEPAPQYTPHTAQRNSGPPPRHPGSGAKTQFAIEHGPIPTPTPVPNDLSLDPAAFSRTDSESGRFAIRSTARAGVTVPSTSQTE